MTEKTDEQLIRLYAHGDNAAFDVLYTRYKKPIYHYCYRQVSTASHADELHQDIWLKVIKSAAQFKQQASFKTWLYKIAHNRLVDYYRQQDRRLHLHVVATEAQASAQEVPTIEQKEPDQQLNQQQVQTALLHAVQQLPEEQKEVFLLHANSGLSLMDIANITHSSFESTKSRLRYATRKLRQHLSQYLGVRL